jgi:phosphoglycolate phosphatase-like HAD superfamily hydrolase
MSADEPFVTGADERPLAVFDLDGTLSDTRHRLHFVTSGRGRKDWDAFFRAASADPPLPDGVALAREWAERCEIGYVTGRPEHCRRATRAWLADQDLPLGGPLWMRPPGDRRPARVTKPALLRRLAAEREIAVVVDDDEQVCTAYEKAGFPVVRADWMPPAEALERAQEDEGRT